MKIKELLLTAHSKQVTSEIVSSILSGQAKIAELMDCFFSNNQLLCQRAAWAVGIIGEKRSELLTPYISKMIVNASKPLHNAITRNVVRAFQYLHFSENNEGEVYEFCFNQVTDLNQPIAVRCFSFRTCMNIASKHPELINEIKQLIIIMEPDDSPAVRSLIRQAKKFLA